MNKPSIPKVVITKSTNNLGRARNGQDHISGFIFDTTKPASWTDFDDMVVYSVAEAEDAGVDSTTFPVEHYHISEYFRMSGASELWIGFTETAGDFTAISRQARFADGKIRQIGVFTESDLDDGFINSLHAEKISLDAEDKPLSIVATANIMGVDDTLIPDLAQSTAYSVSVITDQSGKGTGADLFGTTSKTVGAVGALLGTMSSIPVEMSVGNVENITTLAGDELDVIADGKGVLYSSKTPAEIEAWAAKQYIILMKHPGLSGTYFGIDYTSIGESDLNRIRLNRTLDKAVRGVGIALRTKLNAVLQLNGDGTLKADTRAALESLSGQPLALMASNVEISAYKVYINPKQDIISTDTLQVAISIVPIGAAEFITVDIGFATSV